MEASAPVIFVHLVVCKSKNPNESEIPERNANLTAIAIPFAEKYSPVLSHGDPGLKT
ncbi:MAG: hypothetical protein ABF904_07485 [Ethanoligenens sp.]